MTVESKRKQKEPLNVFLRRFSERVKHSGVINRYKKGRFYAKPKSKELRKQDALSRKKRTEKMIFLRKTGKIK